MASSSNSRGLVLLLITSGFFITGLLFDYMPIIIDDHIKRTIELATNEEIVSYWSRPPVDIHSYYWLYDVVNPEQFSNGEKMQVRRVGPFHFTSNLEKRILELSSNKYRIIYNSTRYMSLNESFAGSSEPLDAQLTLVNPIYVSIIEGARVQASEAEPQQKAILLNTINKLIERYNESLIMRNISARQALVGRPMPLVEKLSKLAKTFGINQDQVPQMRSANGLLGYVSLTNGTWSGPFEIYTGYQETAKSMGELISYKGKRRLTYYEGKCNRLQASVGELRPMPIDSRQTLELFSPHFCRIAHLRPTGVHKMREGSAISYVIAQEDFLSAQANPDNRCYCKNSSSSPAYSEHNLCSLDGVIELAPCSYDAPLLLSVSNIPLDLRITSSIQDYDPDLFRGEIEQIAPSDDQIQMLISKRVGIPIHADLTMTLLMRVVRDPVFRHTANVPPVSYVPLVTIRETVTIPQRLAQVIVNLESFIALTYHIKVIMYLSAVVLLCWLTGHYYCKTSQQGERVGPLSSSYSTNNNGDNNNNNNNAGSSNAVQRGALTTADERDGSASGSGPNGGGANSTDGIPTAIGQSLDENGGVAGDRRQAMGNNFQRRLTDEQQQRQPQSQAKASNTSGETANRQNRNLGGNQKERSNSQVAAAVAAATAETASSECANSADSNRSLPPSRQASRVGSLDAATSDEQSRPPTGDSKTASQTTTVEKASERNSMRKQQDIGGGRQQDATARSRPEEVGRGSKPALDDGELNDRKTDRTSNGAASFQRQMKSFGARILSKVDELGPERAGPAGGRPSVLDLANCEGEESHQEDGKHQQPPSEHLDKLEQQQQQRKRKNWFMNVCSNFVRMLNGLRTTINDAGKLDISENNYQDKQLEMLAGKIDNWYTDSQQPASLHNQQTVEGNLECEPTTAAGFLADDDNNSPEIGANLDLDPNNSKTSGSSGPAMAPVKASTNSNNLIERLANVGSQSQVNADGSDKRQAEQNKTREEAGSSGNELARRDEASSSFQSEIPKSKCTTFNSSTGLLASTSATEPAKTLDDDIFANASSRPLGVRGAASDLEASSTEVALEKEDENRSEASRRADSSRLKPSGASRAGSGASAKGSEPSSCRDETQNGSSSLCVAKGGEQQSRQTNLGAQRILATKTNRLNCGSRSASAGGADATSASAAGLQTTSEGPESDEEEDEEGREELESCSSDSVAEAADKASTLEQIERALEGENGPPPRPPQPIGSAPTGQSRRIKRALAGTASDSQQDQREESNPARPTMINSSTSFDSVINLNLGLISPAARLNQSEAGDEAATTTTRETGGQQKVATNNEEKERSSRIDESSASTGRQIEELAKLTVTSQLSLSLKQMQQQSNKWPQNELHNELEKKDSPLSQLTNKSSDSASSSGQLKLDSRNGIKSNSQPQQLSGGGGDQSLQVIGAKQASKSAPVLANEQPDNNNKDTNGSLSTENRPNSQQQKQPMPMSRPKLLAVSNSQQQQQQQQQQLHASNGNNILNEKIISRSEHQQQQKQQAAYG